MDIDETRLRSTTDARVWAEEFCKRFHVHDILSDSWVDDETGLMVGWFANAIESAKMLGPVQQDDLHLQQLRRKGDVRVDKPNHG